MTTTTEQIDVARAVDLLQQAVDERGQEYIYKELCVYVLDDEGNTSPRWRINDEGEEVLIPFEPNQCGCLVGLALHKGGVDLQTLASFNEVSASSIPDHFPAVTDDAAEVFQAAQDAQDAKRTWGEAMDRAREKALDLGFIAP